MKVKIQRISILLFLIVLMFACGDTEVKKETNVVPQSTQSISPATKTSPTKFSNVTTKLPIPAFGGVDSVNGVTAPKSGSKIPINGDKIQIAGNYVDDVKKDVAAGVVVVIGDKQFESQYGGERPDIAKALNNPKYLKSQFYAEIPTSEIEKGLHDVKIRVISNDMSGYYESAWTGKIDIK
jgi:hypothetical protein